MSVHSLEAERQAILDRMQARRERYRRMLVEGADLDDAVVVEPHAVTGHHRAARQAITHAPSGPTVYRTAPLSARHNPVVQTLMEHPFLVAIGVATLVAIGPKRIVRGITSSGVTLGTIGTLAANTQSNADLAGRLLTMVGAYVQGRINKEHH
jgi:hypothetical protein